MKTKSKVTKVRKVKMSTLTFNPNKIRVVCKHTLKSVFTSTLFVIVNKVRVLWYILYMQPSTYSTYRRKLLNVIYNLMVV